MGKIRIGGAAGAVAIAIQTRGFIRAIRDRLSITAAGRTAIGFVYDTANTLGVLVDTGGRRHGAGWICIKRCAFRYVLNCAVVISLPFPARFGYVEAIDVSRFSWFYAGLCLESTLRIRLICRTVVGDRVISDGVFIVEE